MDTFVWYFINGEVPFAIWKQSMILWGSCQHRGTDLIPSLQPLMPFNFSLGSLGIVLKSPKQLFSFLWEKGKRQGSGREERGWESRTGRGRGTGTGRKRGRGRECRRGIWTQCVFIDYYSVSISKKMLWQKNFLQAVAIETNNQGLLIFNSWVTTLVSMHLPSALAHLHWLSLCWSCSIKLHWTTF